MSSFLARIALPLLLALCFALPAAPTAVPGEIDVHVEKDGNLVRVDVDLTVEATREEAWNVLTDYDGMAAFVPLLESSIVVQRDGNELTVEQQGKAIHGPLSLRFANVRRIALTPMSEIRSRIVSGDLAPGEVITTLDDAGPAVRVRVNGVYAPNIWVPPVIGPAIIAAETREQWQTLRKEILHRRQN